MKKQVIIKILIIIMMLQSILPIKIMALEQNSETGASSKTVFDPNITYSWEFKRVKDQGYPYNYVLLTPSNASDFSSLPVIVWLHGSDGATQNDGASIANEGLPKILLNKSIGLDRFSAYIVCPQITNGVTGQWNTDAMKTFLDKLKKDYNVDEDNIIITGHSLGGNSSVMLASQMPNYFSKAVIFSSGYVLNISIPTIWYCRKI